MSIHITMLHYYADTLIVSRIALQSATETIPVLGPMIFSKGLYSKGLPSYLTGICGISFPFYNN